MTTTPIRDLRRKQRRRKKIRYLRRRLTETKNTEARRRIIAKIKRISPRAAVPDH